MTVLYPRITSRARRFRKSNFCPEERGVESPYMVPSCVSPRPDIRVASHAWVGVPVRARPKLRRTECPFLQRRGAFHQDDLTDSALNGAPTKCAARARERDAPAL